MSIVNKLKAIADIITPPAGYKTLFFRDDTGVPAVKDENGVVSDLVIPGDASGVTFTPMNALDWTDSVDPGNVDDALNDLATRVNTLEGAEAPDAAIVTYTPTTAADWDGDVDPGDVQEALDQLAERVTDIEESPGSGSSFGTIAVPGQSNVVADASSDTLNLVGAGLAAITTDAGTDTVTITVSVPDASAVPFTPSNSLNWTDSEDPGDVDDALNDLAARVQGLEENPAGASALDDLTDVDAPTPSDGDVLTFDSGSGDWIAAAPTGGGSGAVVQVVNTQTGAMTTGSTSIPHDDTIPQNTEGNEVMTLAITPTSATNKLKIEVVAFATIDVASRWLIGALFQDSTANAIAAGQSFNDTSTAGVLMAFTHYMTAGTTSATTFKVRLGSSGADQITFNGQNGARRLGGVMASSITITEIVP